MGLFLKIDNRPAFYYVKFYDIIIPNKNRRSGGAGL